MQKMSARYQVMLVTLLSVNFGILFFDRNAINFLMPFIQPALKLSFTQVGLLSSALSLTWAISGIFVGGWSDRAGRKKLFIVGAGIIFSLCSFVSGLAANFLMLLGTRLLMGAAEGAVMPISHSLVVAEVSPERRGLAMGVSQNFGSNFLGSFVAAVALPLFAAVLGWRHAFYLAAAPGLLFAALIWFLVKEPEKGLAHTAGERLTLKDALKNKNMALCVLIAILLVSYMVITLTFMPLYLTRMKGMSAQAEGWLIGVLGLSASLGSFIVSAISDRVGRRPVMILIPFLGLLIPFGALLLSGPGWLLAPLFFVGWALIGLFPLFMATIPSEALPARYAATAIGISMGLGEMVGGVGSPFLAGWASDVAGPNAVLWILAALAVMAGLFALGLDETAPRKRERPLAETVELRPAIS